MGSILVLRVVIRLLAVMVLVRWLLVLVACAWLHESLMLSAVHHDVLSLLMALVVHGIGIVGRSLGYRRTRRRRGIIGIATSTTVHWGAGSGQMTGVVVLLVVLIIIEWSGPREPVCSICHLTNLSKRALLNSSYFNQVCEAEGKVALDDSLNSIIGLG